MAVVKLILLDGLPIEQQLRLEEALLRADTDNWCLINTGAPPAIVMGISGKPEKLINFSQVAKHPLPIIKRFSGGGTVVIDPDTLFVTLIGNERDWAVPTKPAAILQWTEQLYRPLFPTFSLREQDYVFGERKFGGNAQYLQKGRWLHHTSFLWDYSPASMELLLLPEKQPSYRQARSHTDFLCTLRPLFPSKASLVAALEHHFAHALHAERSSLQEALILAQRPHRSSTTRIHAGV